MIHKFSYFKTTFWLGMKLGLQDQTKAQKQGDFKANFTILS
jgi:hypothetical protein